MITCVRSSMYKKENNHIFCAYGQHTGACIMFLRGKIYSNSGSFTRSLDTHLVLFMYKQWYINDDVTHYFVSKFCVCWNLAEAVLLKTATFCFEVEYSYRCQSLCYCLTHFLFSTTTSVSFYDWWDIFQKATTFIESLLWIKNMQQSNNTYWHAFLHWLYRNI